ncbi:MAG: chloride channel protein, partial [Bacteroidales bacterium]
LEAAGITIFGTLLSKAWIVPLVFSLALLLKVFSMSFTNAGGGVGGTFGPTLIVGGIAGFVLARIINLTGIAEVSECNFALVGMAGLMSGVMQAPMTAIFLIAEITGGYSLFMPLIITSTISYATIHSIEPYSIYTKRIAKMGALLTHDSDQSVLTLLNTCDLVEKKFIEVNLDDTLGDLVKAVSVSVRNIFPVVDKKGRFQGYILLDDIRKVMFDSSLYDNVYVYSLMKNAPAIVKINDSMESVMHKFETTEAWNLPVVDDENKYIGFVSKSRIFSKYREKLHLVSHN